METFDVSLELLWRYLPEMAQRAAAQGKALLEVIGEVGVAIKLIRPSTRIRRSVPTIEWHEIIAPPVDLLWMRPPRYTHKAHAPGNRLALPCASQNRTGGDLVGVGGLTPAPTEIHTFSLA